MGNRGKIRLGQVEIEEGRKREGLCKVAKAVENMEIRYHPSWHEVFRGQIKYISGYCLGGQVLCMGLLLLLFGYFQRIGTDVRVYLGVASIVSSYIGVFLILELSRCKSLGMMELEQTCYLGVKQIWCVKMIVFGGLDILVLTFMVLGIAKRGFWGMFQVLVYLLVPFVLSNALQLWAFTMLRSQRNEYLQMGAAFFISIASGIPLIYPEMYLAAYFGFWILALVAAIAFLAREILALCRSLEEGENICWN